MSVLITGGNGFLGSSLAIALRDRGVAVRVLDPAPARTDVDWQGIDYRIGGLQHPDVLASALHGVERIYHLASTTVPSTSNLDPAADVSGNLIGSLNLMSAMAVAQVRRIIFFSSGGTVYGDPAILPVQERHPLRPISSYGVVKLAIEQYLMMYRRLGVLEPLILRPSNPYGPRQSTDGIQGAIGAFLGIALADGRLRIWGDGEIVRDYIYVDDLVDLAIHAGMGGECGIYNAGSGTGYSLNQLCILVRELTGKALPAEYLPKRDFDVSKIVLDMHKTLSQFRWSPRVSINDGLSRTWQALQSN